MSPSLALSSHNVANPPPSTSQFTLLKSFSPPPPPSHLDLLPSQRNALLSPLQPLPPSVLAVPASPPRSISLFIKPNYKSSISPPPSNFVSSSAAKDHLNGQSTIVGILLVSLLIVIIIALIICFKKRKNDVPLDSNRSPPPQPNDGLRDAPSPPQLQPILYLPGVHGNPFPWNIIPPPLQVSNSINSLPNNEVQGTPVLRLSGGNFTIQELSFATSCFSEVNLLGESEFGSVHKGVLPTGRRIAVKMLKLDSRQGMQEVFQQEVENISKVHHKHLVSLIGYCVSGAGRLLVYEFVPNNNLEFHLHGIDQPIMKWVTRMRIAIGSAKGLAYLHEDCDPSILHLHMKACNILLDSNFEAKVADFGLAKSVRRTNDDDDDVLAEDVDNFGYLAPEYAASGRASDKADVFSYGVILLELITGCKPLNKGVSLTNDFLVSWARPLLTKALEIKDFNGLADPRLQKDYNSEEMASMVACAAACIRNPDWRRPRMSEIILVLEGDISWSNISEGTPPVQSSSYDVPRSLFFNRRH